MIFSSLLSAFLLAFNREELIRQYNPKFDQFSQPVKEYFLKRDEYPYLGVWIYKGDEIDVGDPHPLVVDHDVYNNLKEAYKLEKVFEVDMYPYDILKTYPYESLSKFLEKLCELEGKKIRLIVLDGHGEEDRFGKNGRHTFFYQAFPSRNAVNGNFTDPLYVLGLFCYSSAPWRSPEGKPHEDINALTVFLTELNTKPFHKFILFGYDDHVFSKFFVDEKRKVVFILTSRIDRTDNYVVVKMNGIKERSGVARVASKKRMRLKNVVR